MEVLIPTELHFHLCNYYFLRFSRMPKKYIAKKKGKYVQHNYEHMAEAVKAVKAGEMSVRLAAERYGLPKSTLYDRVSGRFDLDTKPGRKPVLDTATEDQILKNVTENAEKGFGLSRQQLLTRAGILCKRANISGFRNGTPSKHWWYGLKRRHPEIGLRKPEKLGTVRARMLNSTVVERYLKDLGTIISEHNLINTPQKIWNCDETGKHLEHNPVSVIARRGTRSVVGRTSNDRSNVTIMACVNAAGAAMPPMLIVKGKTKKSLFGYNTAASPKDSVWTYHERAWMNEELGEQWFRNVFLKHCGQERPQLLILDGHGSHETLGLLELAKQEEIIILALPPHTTHYLQPLDRSVFGPFNKAYNKACSNFLSLAPCNIVNKWTFPQMFTSAWEAGLTVQNITSGFRACGIYPYNPAAVPKSAFQPSTVFDRPLSSATTTSETMTNTTEVSLEPLAASTLSVVPLTNRPVSIDNTNSIPDISPPSLDERLTSYEDISNNLVVSAEIHHPVTTTDLNIATSDNNGTAGLLPAVSDIETLAAVASISQIPAELEDPQHLFHLITHGELEIVASANDEGEATLPSSLWNTNIEALFSPCKNTQTCAVPVKKTSRAITSHRLLTSDDVINEKRVLAEKKQRLEAAKEERKLKREMKKK